MSSIRVTDHSCEKNNKKEKREREKIAVTKTSDVVYVLACKEMNYYVNIIRYGSGNKCSFNSAFQYQ